MTTQVAVRLPAELISRLDALVPTTHSSRSEAVRRAIELYLYRLACEHDARQYEQLPLTDAELSLADDPDAWSHTPPWCGARFGGQPHPAAIDPSSCLLATR